jgi:hypothetical protein
VLLHLRLFELDLLLPPLLLLHHDLAHLHLLLQLLLF